MLVDSQQRHGVVIVGPVVEDTSWQAHAAEGFSKADFHVDWDQQVVTCPEGSVRTRADKASSSSIALLMTRPS
jgi:transposase